MEALIGKPIDLVGTEVAFADVKVGDVILFSTGSAFTDLVVDADTVVAVDADGIYFDGPSYIEPVGSPAVVVAQ